MLSGPGLQKFDDPALLKNKVTYAGIFLCKLLFEKGNLVVKEHKPGCVQLAVVGRALAHRSVQP